MVLQAPHQALVELDVSTPEPGPGQVLVRVRACGVCRTDLHLVDGELPKPKLPITPGHEVIGVVEAVGDSVDEVKMGQRVGIPWLGWTCGQCAQCAAGRENLCERARFTGYTLDGGYAEYAVADARYCFALDSTMSDAEAAPLMCAGLIGYRSLRMAGDAQHLGIYGFGAAAHLIAQVAIAQGRQVYAFTKPGDQSKQDFALSLGASWAGGADETPPHSLDASLIFAPAGPLVPAALRVTAPGGRVVCGGIHMSDIPSFPYELLWKERSIHSVANLTRQDGIGFLSLVKDLALRSSVREYPLSDANRALSDLRDGNVTGAAVLVP